MADDGWMRTRRTHGETQCEGGEVASTDIKQQTEADAAKEGKTTQERLIIQPTRLTWGQLGIDNHVQLSHDHR